MFNPSQAFSSWVNTHHKPKRMAEKSSPNSALGVLFQCATCFNNLSRGTEVSERVSEKTWTPLIINLLPHGPSFLRKDWRRVGTKEGLQRMSISFFQTRSLKRPSFEAIKNQWKHKIPMENVQKLRVLNSLEGGEEGKMRMRKLGEQWV